MKPVRTLIVLADDAAARFLVNDGVGKGLREVAVLDVSQFPQDSLVYADRKGRSSGGGRVQGRHAVDPHTALEVQHRGRFAAHLIEALAEQWRSQAPDRLILAAPPKMLGDLRGRLPAGPAAALLTDLPKDLVNTPLADLPRHLAKVLAV